MASESANGRLQKSNSDPKRPLELARICVGWLPATGTPLSASWAHSRDDLLSPVIVSDNDPLAVVDLWNWLLASTSHTVYIFHGHTVLRDFGKGVKKKVHKLLLASSYSFELIGKVVGQF